MRVYALASNVAYAPMGPLLSRWLAQGRRLLGFNRVNRAMAVVLVLTVIWRGEA